MALTEDLRERINRRGEDATKPEMEGRDISWEEWRQYTWVDPVTEKFRKHFILEPKLLFYELGHTCHRVVDSEGVSHCIPAPGYFGCVLKWKNQLGASPVNF